jgi:PPP family 3-phenylpropionic acid transporter
MLRMSETLARIRRARAAASGESARLGALYFLFYGSNAAWFSYFGLYLQHAGLTGMQIGLVAGVRPAVIVLCQPLWGLAGDLWGRRRTLLLASTLAATGLLAYLVSPAFWFLFAWTILYAVMSNPVGSLVDSLVLDHLETAPGQTFGQFRLWGAIGWAVFALVVGQLIAGRSLSLVWIVAAIAMAFVPVLTWGTSNRRASAGGRAAWADAAAVLRDGRLLAFLGAVTLMQMGTSAMNTFFPIYMQQIGASRQVTGAALSLQGICEIPVYLSAAWIINKVGLRKALVVALLVMAARCAAYAVVGQPAVAVALQVVHGSFSLFLVCCIQYVNEIVPPQWRATGQALFWAAQFGVGAIIGNTVAGTLYDRVGLSPMFAVCGAFMVCSAIAAVFVVKETPAVEGAA